MVIGQARDVMLAAVMGVGPVADAFVVALRIPNHFRAIFGEGAFNSAFVPTYASAHETSGAALDPRVSGVFWTHGDSGADPVLFAVDAEGRLVGADPRTVPPGDHRAQDAVHEERRGPASERRSG